MSGSSGADGAERCLVTAPVVPAGGVRGGRGRTKTAVGILAPPHYNHLRGRQALLKPCGLHRLGGDVVSVKVSGRRAAPGRFTDSRASPIMRDASPCPVSQYDMFCLSVCVCVCAPGICHTIALHAWPTANPPPPLCFLTSQLILVDIFPTHFYHK